MDLIADQFRDAASRNPQALAIIDGPNRITYGQLASRVEDVARSLVALAAIRDPQAPRLIAIMMSHSAEAVTVILGAVLAGWAYTPLDVDAEPDTLVQMLTRCGSTIVVTDHAHMVKAQEISGRQHMVLDTESLLQRRPLPASATGPAEMTSDALAYILYTSGSRGPAKPVYHTRASLLRSVACYRADSNLEAMDRVSLMMPLWFTPSVFCLFGSLLSGATLCVFDKRHGFGSAISNWVKSQKLTLLYMTPTIFRRWANTLPDFNTNTASTASFRMIQLAGEPLLASDVALFQRKFADGVKLYNGMGTAETSCAARFFIDHEMTFPDGSVPIGYPYDDVALIVRNADGRIVGAGEVGNLFIRPNLIADDEFDTGDLAMREEGGRLVHFGRSGDHVIIDGVVVDLFEIESLLMHRSDVREAAIFVESADGAPSLTAAITFVRDVKTVPEDLQVALAVDLPEQMIPTSWIVSESLPILGTGKLDRTALKALARYTPQPKPTSPGRSDTLDADLLDLFRRILGKPDLAANHNFFNAGGNLAMALELTMEIERKFGTGLSVSRLGRAPTAINLAHALRRQSMAGHVEPSIHGLLGTVWQLDHSRALQIRPLKLSALPATTRSLLDHDQSMTATLQVWSASPVSLNVLAQRQAGRFFMRKIELAGGGRTLAIAGIRIDLAVFAPSVRLEILAGDTPFGMIVERNRIQTQHRLQQVFETLSGEQTSFGRTNRIEDTTGAVLADVVEVLSSTL